MVDLSDPAQPTEVGHYETPGTAKGIHVSDDLVFVADGEGGLAILRHSGVAAATDPDDRSPKAGRVREPGRTEKEAV
jgi:hypothetical protein